MSAGIAGAALTENCTTHHHACERRERLLMQEIERLQAEVAGLRHLFQVDSLALMEICIERDKARRERDELRARIDGDPVCSSGIPTWIHRGNEALWGKRVALVVIDE